MSRVYMHEEWFLTKIKPLNINVVDSDYYDTKHDMLYCSILCAKSDGANPEDLYEVSGAEAWDKLAYEHPNASGEGPHFGRTCKVCEEIYYGAF